MEDSEKIDSSTGDAKVKISLLDEDFSKDFLSSWRMGGDDMDFNFEPVSKGKKKAFDFGMDIDFSLDDAFGKMLSFKMDMSDIDFSVSPSKSTKSKEKSEEKSAKGNCQDKLDRLKFSFDFDGEPTTAKTMLLENKVMNSKLPVVQATVDGDRTELSPSEDNQEGLTHMGSVNSSCSSYESSKGNGKKPDDHPSSCTKELTPSDSVMEKIEKNAATCTPLRDHDDTVNRNHKNEASVDTVLHIAKAAKDGLPSLDYEKMTNNVKSSRVMNFSLDDTFGKMSSFKGDMPDVDFSNSQNKSTKSMEKSEEDSSKGNCLDKHDKVTLSFDSNVEPTAAKTMPLENKVPGAMNSNFTSLQATNDGCRPELSASEDNQDGSTNMDAVNRSCSNYGSGKQNGTKLDDHPSSCTKELIQSNSIVEKSEKKAAAPTPPRDHDDTGNGKNRNEVNVDTMLHKGKEAKDGLPSLEYEKMTNSVKSSCFKIHSLTPPEQGTKFGNQRQGNLKDRISSIGMIQKLNIGQGNKLSSQRVDKKMFALPSLKITRHTTREKHPAAPTMPSNATSPGSVEKNAELQAMIKTVIPVFSEKQTPSTPSLKRKQPEAADMGPAKLHMPKRFSPNGSRMSRVSAREMEDGDQTQGNFVEGSAKNVSAENKPPEFDFDQEENMAALQFSLMLEDDANVEKAESCAKELDNICNMLKKKHEEAKELLVRALVNNNNLLMLTHPIYEEKISFYLRPTHRILLLSVLRCSRVMNFAEAWKNSCNP